jgi:hypothetical protein
MRCFGGLVVMFLVLLGAGDPGMAGPGFSAALEDDADDEQRRSGHDQYGDDSRDPRPPTGWCGSGGHGSDRIVFGANSFGSSSDAQPQPASD